MSENNSKLNTGRSAVARVKERDMLRRQRRAIIAMVLVIALLVAALAVALYWIDIFVYEDIDGSEYYVKKIDGEY